MKWVKRLSITVATLAVILYTLVYSITFHPDEVEQKQVLCEGDEPVLKPGQNIKVLSYNIQYLAGKGYVFWYDVPGDLGPDNIVAKEDIYKTLDAIVKIIEQQNPDIILFQELHENAKRTHFTNQEQLFAEKLKQEYGCRASAFYWKSSFIPHPKILGSVGMKLTTFSRYKISKATRYQLAPIPDSWPTSEFNFKRAMLETRLPVEGAAEVAAVNTHLDAFAQGTDTMQKQVEEVDSLLSQLQQQGVYWFIGGDFNLLPHDDARKDMPPENQKYYNSKTELNLLTAKYNMVPSLEDTKSAEKSKWYTHFSNNPKMTAPNKTIDYIFYSENLKLVNKSVMHGEALKVSDHMPLFAEFAITPAPSK